MSDKKAVIKNADMSDEMQQDAVDCAMQAMEKYNIEKDIAAYVKKVCRLKHNWHQRETFIVSRFNGVLCCAYYHLAGVWQEVQPHLALHCREELW